MRLLVMVLVTASVGCGARNGLDEGLGDGSAALADAGAIDTFGLVAATCGPDDGRAWLVAVTETEIDCGDLVGEAPPGTSLAFLIDDPLSGGGGSFDVGGGVLAARCGRSIGECINATSGTVVVERFVEGTEIVLRWDLVMTDGGSDEGRARLTQFCPSDGPCG